MGWKTQLSDKQLKEIALNLIYAEQFHHGTDGHGPRMLIAKLAGLLDKLDSGQGPAGVPFADEWGLPITGDPLLWYLRSGHEPSHTGNDWNLKTGGDTDLGEAVVSVGTGLVVYSGEGRGVWGNLVIVQHLERSGELTCWRYAHLGRRDVNVGQVVEKGQPLGTIGKGGWDRFSAHLHLDARRGGVFDSSEWLLNITRWFDPLPFLLARGVAEINQVEKRYSG